MPATVVERYAAAKSRQDVEAALALCEPDFTIETIPFALESTDRADTAAQLQLFFSVFPDYRAETGGLARNDDTVAWWGRISVTFRGEFLGLSPTGRSTTLPAFSVFDLRGDRLVRERFYFDLHMLCEGIGVPTPHMVTALGPLRARAA